MKISLRWINEFVDISDFFHSPKKLIDRLTHAGFEVEALKNYSQKYKNLVIGEVLNFSKHPNADKLRVCEVNIGQKKLSIICGATNFKIKDKVVVALQKAFVKSLNGKGIIEITSSEIRGVLSEGMLCAKEELDFDSTINEMVEEKEKSKEEQTKAENNGILILPMDSTVGEDFSKFFGFDDIILDVDVTPNRPDCLSHWGLSREIASLLKRPYKKELVQYSKKKMLTFLKDSSDFEEEDGLLNESKNHLTQNGRNILKKNSFKIQIEKKKLCLRYSAQIMRNIQVGPSPKWLSQRLKILSLQSHNNIVDITNYVMLELGQPLHAFDFNSLRGNKVTINSSLKGENFLALNDKELKLTGNELTIRDEKGPLALAGIIGGKESSINEKTSSIFLESAYFSSSSVRQSARFFGLETDSSLRFSRGVDPMALGLALKRATLLIEKYAKGKKVGEILNQSFYKQKSKEISISLSSLQSKLGISVKPNDFIQWMKALNCKLKKKKNRWVPLKEVFVVSPPTYRLDLKEDVDLVEEYARLNGYDKILESTPHLKHFPLKHSLTYRKEEKVSDFLVREGFFETINLCFTSYSFQKNILGFEEHLSKIYALYEGSSVFIKNPLNQEINVMRRSLIPGLIKNCVFNCNYKRNYGRLFEVGKIFSKKSDTENLKTKFNETSALGLIGWNEKEGLWKSSKSIPLVYELKSVLQNFFHFSDINSIVFDKIESESYPGFLHPLQSQVLKFKNKIVGFIGTLHPIFKKKFKLNIDVSLAELSLSFLNQEKEFKFQNPSKFPTIERDLSFVLSDQIPASSMVSYILEKKIPILKSIHIFDVYKDSKIGKGKKALAFKLLFQDKNQTLLENKVAQYQKEIIKGVSSQFSAQLRVN